MSETLNRIRSSVPDAESIMRGEVGYGQHPFEPKIDRCGTGREADITTVETSSKSFPIKEGESDDDVPGWNLAKLVDHLTVGNPRKADKAEPRYKDSAVLSSGN